MLRLLRVRSRQRAIGRAAARCGPERRETPSSARAPADRFVPRAQRTRSARTFARRCGSRAPPRLGGPVVAEAVLAVALAAAGDQHAVRAAAQRVLDERGRQLGGAQAGSSAAVRRPRASRTSAPQSQPNTTMRGLPRGAACLRSSRRAARRSAAAACRCRSPVSPTLRNGVDDGQAPAQMPQAAHRVGRPAPGAGARPASVRGTSHRRRTGNRRSSGRSRCSWPRLTRATGAGSRVGQQGAHASTAQRGATDERPQPAGDRAAYMSGCRNR